MRANKFILSFVFVCCFVSFSLAQTITGVVVDQLTKQTIPGANIIVVGQPNVGTTSDVDGKFSMEIPNGAKEINVSFIGYKSINVAVINERTYYEVVLEPESTMLSDAVVVGFGTQKKENLTGAVTSVNVNRFLEDRPITNIARGLQGAVPGLTITSTTGDLGSSPTINIRGSVGSPNGSSSPLILVDNVVTTDLNLVNPEDIASMSVLKDAAATSIYGARAAFGVILITTKSQKIQNKTSVTYSNNFALRRPTYLADQLPGWQQAEINLTAERRLIPGKADYVMVGSLYQNDKSIAEMKKWEQEYGGKDLGPEMVYGRDFEIIGEQQFYYRTWNWRDMFYKTWMPQQIHNISINSSSEKTSVFISAGYLGQQGMTKINTDEFDRYNANLGVNSKMYKWLTVRANAMYSKTIRETPFVFNTTSQGLYDYMYYLYRWQPFYPYGTLDGKPFRSAITELEQAPRNRNEQTYFRLGGGVTIDIMEGLTLDADFYYSNSEIKTRESGAPVFALDFWSAKSLDQLKNSYGNYISPSLNYAQRTSQRTELYTTNVYAVYNKKINNVHSFKLTTGTNIESSETMYLMGKRMNLFDPDYPELNLGYGDQYASSAHSHWSVLGFFARINYDYKGKYLLELNGRYDGSSSFPTQTQWGFFPSLSAGWRITEEPFMDALQPVLSSLKLRASYGSIGNQNVGANRFRSIISVNNKYNWLINGNFQGSASMPSVLPLKSLTWETVTTINFGIDARLLSNRLGVTFDWYRRTTSNLLSSGETLPETFGIAAPLQNYGELQTPGWELAIDYNFQFSNGMSLTIGGQLTDYYTKVSKWAADSKTKTVPTYNNWSSGYYKNMVLGDIWGYKVDRLFQEGDFNADGTLKDGIPNQSILESGAFKFGPGDVKYKDLDDNGKISYESNTVEKSGDKTILGNIFPRLQYGFTIDLLWKGFDFNVFFQGVGKRKLWVGGNMVLPGFTSGEPWFKGQDDYWTPQNTGAFYPRPTVYGQSMAWNYQVNDRYLLNMAYLRCKSLTIGYTLPKNLVNKIHITNLRIYATGENLFEFTKLKVPIDPETGITSGTNLSTGNEATDARNYGRSYPYQRTFSIGLQVTL